MRLVLKGQIRGGKNNVLMTRTGRRYPNPIFTAWVADAHRQIVTQIGPAHCRKPIDGPGWYWNFIYTPEDNRRRDAPAVLDGLLHLFEKAGIVTDDRWVANFHYTTMPASKENAGIVIDYTEIKNKL